MQVPVLNMQGSQVGTLTIDENALGGAVNSALIKQAYVRYHANKRQGSARTKNRREIEGSTRKIYKQKGTGNARHGDKKSNIFRGGGHGHSKKRVREDYRLDMPKKMRRKANRNALLSKLLDNEVRIIDNVSMPAPKTKDFITFMTAVKADGKTLIALPGTAEEMRRAARNVESVGICSTDSLNCFEMLNHRYLVIAKADLEAWLAGPSSQIGKDAKRSPMGEGGGNNNVSASPAGGSSKPAAAARRPAKEGN
ncbi:50S ribosomal protein L4 [soil metagenome]